MVEAGITKPNSLNVFFKHEHERLFKTPTIGPSATADDHPIQELHCFHKFPRFFPAKISCLSHQLILVDSLRTLSASVPEVRCRLEYGVAAILLEEADPRDDVYVFVVPQLVDPHRQVAKVAVPQRLVRSQPLVSPKDGESKRRPM